MNQSDGITKAIEVLSAHNLPVSDRLRAEVANVGRGYRVAVVGEFKVGKSTLINKVFLGDSVLFTDVLCATAVPTTILNAPHKELTVTRYRKESQRVTVATQEAYADVTVGTTEPIVTPNPSPDDIRMATAGDSQDQRGVVARTTAEVILRWPAPSLGDVAVVDTPGINESGNEAVLQTTYRVIPEADCVVFLKTAKSLSVIERSFLTGKVFEEGVSRALVLLNYDPTYGRQSADSLKELGEAIRAEFARIGRGHLPVHIITLNFDAAVAPPVIGTATGIREVILQYVDANARPGRMERANFVIRRDLACGLIQVQAELAALGKTATELDKLAERLRCEEARIEENRQKIEDDFSGGLEIVKGECERKIKTGIEKIGLDYLQGFEALSNLGQAQERLQRASVLLQPEVERLLSLVGIEAREKVNELCEAYSQKAKKMLKGWREITLGELSVDGGLISKLSPTAVLVLDVLIFATIMPTGPLIDVVLRVLGEKIPILRSIMPSALAKMAMVSAIRKSVTEEMGKTRDALVAKIGDTFVAARKDLLAEIYQTFDAEIAATRRAMENAAKPPPGRQEALQRAKQELELTLNALPAK